MIMRRKCIDYKVTYDNARKMFRYIGKIGVREDCIYSKQYMYIQENKGFPNVQFEKETIYGKA